MTAPPTFADHPAAVATAEDSPSRTAAPQAPELPAAPRADGSPGAPPPGGLLRAAPHALRSRTALAMACLAVLVAIPYALPDFPGRERLRLLQPLPPGKGLELVAPPSDDAPVGEAAIPERADGHDSTLALPAEAASAPLPQPGGDIGPVEAPPVRIDDPSGRALEPFFAALDRVVRKEPGAIARIGFWGDSNVAGDLVSGVLRRRLQARFGDAGHGFVQLAPPTEWDHHNDVRRFASNAWSISRIPGPLAADGLYGIGGVVFKARGAAAFGRVGTVDEGDFGRRVSRFVVGYLAEPDGQGIDLLLDGHPHGSIETRATTTQSKQHVVEVPDGPHELELRARAVGERVFGVMLERDGPGVVVDAFGVTSAKIRHLGRIDREHWHAELAARAHALLVFNFGVNESREGERQFGIDEYERTTHEVLADIRAARPDAACLVVSPNDIAWKTPAGDRLSQEIVGKLARAQRKVAHEVGCAFWDMYQAMGGEGAMGEWVAKGLARPDMLHPTAAGADKLGSWLANALLTRYVEARGPR